MVDEQGTDTKVEGVVEPTPPENEPTVYKTEEDFQTAVSKGLESVTKQLNLRDAEVRAVKAGADKLKVSYEATTAQIEILKKEAEEALSDDPEKRDAYISKIKALEREQGITTREADLTRREYEVQRDVLTTGLQVKSIELKSKFQVPQEVLDTCITEEQMEVVAKAFPEVKEAEKELKLDNATSSAAGSGLRDLSSDEKVKYALEHPKKRYI